MKKIFSAAFVTALFFISCAKEELRLHPGDSENPAIKIISPLNIPNLQPGDQLTIRAIITDNKLINTVAWELMNTVNPCGNNPYKGVYSMVESIYEMNEKFLLPEDFSGNMLIRIYAVDNTGNFSTKDINFIAGK